MAKKKQRPKDAGDDDVAAPTALHIELSREQRRAIIRHVPADMRWVASHPFLANAGSTEEYGSGKEWLTAAKRLAKTPPPSPQSLNMLWWAIKAQDKFWTDYNRRCDSALKKHEKDREQKLLTTDTPERLALLRKSLDDFLAARGLSRFTMPPPQFPEPTTG